MEKIRSQKDLYMKLLPALRTKKHELDAANLKFIREIDIWNYNKLYNWRDANGLTLASMVDNILNTPNALYADYKIEQIKKSDENENN
jgi:hypothetical protein